MVFSFSLNCAPARLNEIEGCERRTPRVADQVKPAALFICGSEYARNGPRLSVNRDAMESAAKAWAASAGKGEAEKKD